MTQSVLPNCEDIEKALLGHMRADISCRQEGDALVIDTPYVLLDGHFLEVFIEAANGRGHIFSDGGFLQRQVGIYSSTRNLQHGRAAEIERIARSLDLEWKDFELRFHETDLDQGVRRLTVLVEAMNRALAVVQAKPRRREVELRKQLAAELRKVSWLKVSQRARLEVGDARVRIDYIVRRLDQETAVEVLGGRTESGSAISVDHAIANFQVLHHYDYPGRMVGVYDEASPAARPELMERFRTATPPQTLLVAGRDAAHRIALTLAA